jgi:hypothetical protein
MILLERRPPEATISAVTLASEEAIGSENWKLLISLLPIIGRLHIESCLENLINLINEDPGIQGLSIAGESLYRNIFRCLASFRDPKLSPLFKYGLTNKEIADVCFTALLQQDQDPFDLTFVDDIVSQFRNEADYLLQLLQRFLAEASADPRSAVQALYVLREISQDSSDALGQRLDKIIDAGLDLSSHPNRSPTRNEIMAISSLRMRDLELKLEQI